ncbi:MAG TPA: DUF3472 domain-containing protein, partial [Chthonomonadales bacterium]|nr:DUF3472 domain-containing protein [Chthonomonadales bacterium]
MGVSTVPVHAAAHTTGTQAGETLVVPASTAYSEPRIDLAEISSAQGVTSWKPGGQIVWYGRVGSGALECGISVVPRDLKPVQFVIHAGRAAQKSSFEPARLNALTIWFPAVRTGSGGPIRISLSAASGGALPNVQSLLLRGPAAADAVFNTLPAQRGAPSVHLTYTVPSGDQVGVFYVEVTPRIGPLWTYFEACGWHRGYFGMQINSPTERRIIFSVWDAGTEAVDRSKVAAENRVQLLAKGAGVFAGSFGNEGTGGHSHLVYHWHFNRTYRFLVVAQPKGSSTTYSGFFYFPERKAWGLIASFKAPRDGAY